jgi:hypothetical protein
MCRPVTCKTCSKTTWAGCGQHIGHVKAMVPADQWCPGHPKTGLLQIALTKLSPSQSRGRCRSCTPHARP